MGLVVVVSSFFKALGQLGDPRFRKVLFLGIGLTFALLVAAYAGLLWFFELIGAEEFLADTLGDVTWIGQLLSGASFLLMIVLSVFLMVPVASAITSMFLDEVAQAVEDKHYPDLPPAMNVPFGDALRDTLSFLGILIVANVLAFIVYAMFPPFSMFIFWALNGFLLGREYFQLAAMRRVGREGAKEMRRRYAGTIWLAGTLMAVPLSLPLVNLLIPILGAATFTQLYHQLSQKTGT
ncbi:EI24 domain-containing protein [Shimia biformata]|uniref:EI24 domain-containing protein n=1 Tax=Shimia biformata TaxID=1294299 RepID=UPI001950ADFA|nr:EI24 domain-containing protein [Shimia biformata]